MKSDNIFKAITSIILISLLTACGGGGSDDTTPTKKAQASLTGLSDQTKTLGDAKFTLTVNGGSGIGTISYTSSNPNVASVNASSGEVTIKTAGPTTITATKAGDTTYKSITASYLLTVNKKPQTSLTGLSDTTKTVGDATFTLTISGGSGSGAISYISSKPTVASVDTNSGIVTIKTTGTTTITATKAGDNNYKPTSASYSLTVNNTSKLQQSPLTGLSNQTKDIGDGKFTLTASGGSGSGAISYISSKPTVASVNASSGEVTILTAGITTITATKAGDETYDPISTSYLLTINDPSKLPQSTLTISPVQQKTFGDGTFTLTVNGGSGNGAISYNSSNAGVASIDTTSGIVTINSAGTTKITATRAGNATYNLISATYLLTINKNTQTSLTGLSDTSKTFGDVPFTLAVNGGGSGGGAISYNSSNATIASVDASGEVTILAAGTATITATKAGDNNYNPISTSYLLTINKSTQTLLIGLSDTSKTFGDDTFTLAISSGNGSGTISYTSSNATVAIVNATSGTVTIKSAGTTTITVTKAGDNNYYPISATYLLTINKSPQASLTGLSNTTKAVGDASFTLTVNGGSGSGTISYNSSNATVAIINATSGTITIKSAGTATITATKAGDNNYHPISTSYLLTINPAIPVINSSVNTLTAIVNTAITTITINSSGGLVASYAISTTLSGGLNFDTTTGKIFGTPSVAKSATTYTITASNVTGSASTTVSITVLSLAKATAIAKIEAYNNGNGINPTSPTVADYVTAGVTGVTTANIVLVNVKILAADTSEANTRDKIQALVDEVIAVLGAYGVVVSPHTGRIWLDRNLGASQICTSSADSACFGDLYQWGRAADGHEKRISGTTTTLATSITAINDKFITADSPYDWTTADPDGFKRIQAMVDGGSNAVCPSGFSIPTESEFKSETSGKINSVATAFSHFLKLPKVNYRYTTTGSIITSISYYQSSTFAAGLDASYLDINDGVYKLRKLAHGTSIRCIQTPIQSAAAPAQPSPTILNVQDIKTIQLTLPTLGSRATFYEIYHHTNNDQYAITKTIDRMPNADGYIYTQASLTLGSHYYWLKACNNSVCSGFSAIAKAELALFTSQTDIDSNAVSAASANAADLNGDGHLDMLTADAYKFAWYKNDGSGNFSASITIDGTLFDGFSAIAADLDGDKDLDVITIDKEKVLWYQNTDSLGNFSTNTEISHGNTPRTVIAQDIDKDGHTDIIVSYYIINDGKIIWYKNNGNKPPVFTAQTPISSSKVRAIVMADLDNDGSQDILAARSSANKITWYKNNGSGSFTIQTDISTSSISVAAVSVADLDSDGYLDVVYHSAGSDDRIYWHKNNGSGGFATRTELTNSNISSIKSIHTADLNGTGKADVLTTSISSDKVKWYQNNGGSFNTKTDISSISNPRFVSTADIDNDGDFDVLVAANKKIQWIKNNHTITPLSGSLTYTTTPSATFGVTKTYRAITKNLTGSPSNLSYAITSVAVNGITINPKTGEITISSTTTATTHTLTITVTSPIQSSAVTVDIDITVN